MNLKMNMKQTVSMFFGMLAITGCGLPIATDAMRGSSGVEVVVRDEQGQPVAAATVWGYGTQREVEWENLREADLKRLVRRYADRAEFITGYYKPLTFLNVMTMTDDNGRSYEALDDYFGRGKSFEGAEFGVAVFKRGFEPLVRRFQYDGNNSARLEFVLKRSSDAKTVPDYLIEFDHLRYELSDEQRNAQMTFENAQRLADLRQKLLKLAEVDEKTGDLESAAKIYLKTSLMPEIEMVDTPSGKRISGFKHLNIELPKNIAARKKAASLALDAVFVEEVRIDLERKEVTLLDNRFIKESDPALWQAHTVHLAKIERLIAHYPESVLPRFYTHLPNYYAQFGEFEKACKALKAAVEFEPLHTNYEETLDYIRYKAKAKAKAKGVAIDCPP